MVKWLSRLLDKTGKIKSFDGNGTGRLAGEQGNPISEGDSPTAVPPFDIEVTRTGNLQVPAAGTPAAKIAESEAEALIHTEKQPSVQTHSSTIVEELLLQRPAEKIAIPPSQVSQIRPLNISAVYNGEVELAISAPMEMEAISKLFTYLQSTPDLKVLYTRGSWDRGTVITVVLDKPMPLLSMISNIQGLQIAPGVQKKDMLIKGTSSSLLAAKKKDVPRLDLALKVV